MSNGIGAYANTAQQQGRGMEAGGVVGERASATLEASRLENLLDNCASALAELEKLLNAFLSPEWPATAPAGNKAEPLRRGASPHVEHMQALIQRAAVLESRITALTQRVEH